MWKWNISYRALKGNEVYISYLFFNVSNTSKGLYYFPEIAVELQKTKEKS